MEVRQHAHAKAAVDSILQYDSKVKTALMNEKVLGDLMVNMQHAVAGIFNMQSILETVGRNPDDGTKKND